MRQVRDTVDLATDDVDLKFKIIQDALAFLAENFDENLQSNSTGTRIQQYIKKETGCEDPYKLEKIESNRIALDVLPKVREILKEDDSLKLLENNNFSLIGDASKKENSNSNVYLLGMIVHNSFVTEELSNLGIITLDDTNKTK